jgi:D-alanyl-D-alanine carboxypeptidase
MTAPGDRLRQLLEDFRDRCHVPAVGGGVVTRDGDLTLDVVGSRKRGDPAPAGIDDQWHIGSCAKAITAVLYARLVERGDAAWGVPIRDFFRDLSGQLGEGWSEPTVDEVLVCRSGMRANLGLGEMLAGWKDTSPVTEQRTRAVVSALSRPPKGRGAFRYSNLGYIVIGAAIDRITGMPFEEALRLHVLEPLGITSVGFGAPPHIWGHKPRLRLGRLVAGRASPMDPANPRSDNPAVMTPAGRLHLTLADWAKFQRVFLNQGRPLLQPATVEHLLAVPPAKRPTMAMGWAAARGRGLSYGMQGSNTMWAATALVDVDYERTAMVVVNEGRTRVLFRSAQLAVSMLQMGRSASA